MLRNFGRVLRRQSIGIIALVVVLSSGTAYAASAMWTGANIVDGSLTGADIKSGSITSTQLAPGTTSSTGGGSSTGTPGLRVQFDPPGMTTNWYVRSGSDPFPVASKDFNVPQDGFVDIQFTSHLQLSSDSACAGNWGVEPGVQLEVTVDDESDADAITYSGSPNEQNGASRVGTRYLTAGTHTLHITGLRQNCDGENGPEDGTGTVTISGTHVLAYMP